MTNMVTEIYSQQLKWFTQELIRMRVREIDGYHAPIDFNPDLITNCASISFDTVNKTPQEHTIRMLIEIRGFLNRTTKLTPPYELFWTVLKNKHIKIAGYTTELLRIFLKEFLEESLSLFAEGQDNEGRPILTYCEQHTIIPITGNELAVFRCLLRKFGQDVSFEELSGAIRSRENILHGTLAHRELKRATEKERETVQSAVNIVRKKLKMATGDANYPEIIENVRGVGYKMII